MSRYAWHFITAERKSAHGDQVWVDGETETYAGRYKIKPCVRGLHSSPTPFDALQYTPGPLLSLVEIPDEGPDCIPHGDTGVTDKHVSTWRRRILTIDVSKELRLFACDVAEEALNREVEAGRTVDERSRAAIEVARRFAQGLASQEELAAAMDAAWARDAAWAARAAWAAAWAAWAAWAASAAAWAAARDAAMAAAMAAYKAKFNALIEPLFAEAMVHR